MTQAKVLKTCGICEKAFFGKLMGMDRCPECKAEKFPIEKMVDTYCTRLSQISDASARNSYLRTRVMKFIKTYEDYITKYCPHKFITLLEAMG